MTAGTFNVNVSGPSMHLIVRLSLPSSVRTCFRRTKQTKQSKRATCTMLLFRQGSHAQLVGHVPSAFPRGSSVHAICRRLYCCFRVTLKSKCGIAHRFGLRRFYRGFGRFPMRASDTLHLLAHYKCVRCARRRRGTSHVRFLLRQSRLCQVRRLRPRRRLLVR